MKKEDITAKYAKDTKTEKRPVFVFFVRFLLFFVILMTVHFYTRLYTAYVLITKLNAGVSSSIINLITPAERAVVEGQVIHSGTFGVTVARGCDGMDGILLVTAALLAFPMKWKRRLAGIGLGIMLLYGANLVRIVSLYYVTRYQPDWFDLMHIYIWQTLTIFLGVIYFVWWTGRKTESVGCKL